MKNKIKVIIVVIIASIIGLYFGYKAFNLTEYNTDSLFNNSYKEFLKGLDNKDTIKIKKESYDTEDYIELENIKFVNKFKEFEKDETSEDFFKYFLYKDEEFIASFWVGEDNNYISYFVTDVDIYGDHNSNGVVNLKSFFKKNKINTDVDLFNYLNKNKDYKNNIFTSTKKMKENYSINLLSSIIFPSIESFTLIEGDLNGYILNVNDNIKEVSIIDNDKRYIFTFIGAKYFNKNDINEILNSIVIN